MPWRIPTAAYSRSESGSTLAQACPLQHKQLIDKNFHLWTTSAIAAGAFHLQSNVAFLIPALLSQQLQSFVVV